MAVAVGSALGAVPDQLSIGMRNAVGLRPYTPSQAAGLRIPPAKIPVPMPKQLPLAPPNAPSPPDGPPAERSVL
ncbi:MAG: hypothetical protein Q9170_002983 [Blastenia crenularia]